MSTYYMELPDAEYNIIQIAYDYIKRNFPHLTDGFDMSEELINDFRKYPVAVFRWSRESAFLGWGTSDGYTHKIPFPDINCVVLGEIE